MEVGCTSLGSFSSRFTELVGETPSTYRDATTGNARPALAEFERVFFNNLVPALDRYYVHRLRMVTGRSASRRISSNGSRRHSSPSSRRRSWHGPPPSDSSPALLPTDALAASRARAGSAPRREPSAETCRAVVRG